MQVRVRIALLFLLCSLLGAQALPEDPVVKARARRAQAEGPGDLPPVPRTVLDPPPLAPPESHVKDTPGGRAKAKAQRKTKASRRSKAAKKGRRTAKADQAPAKVRKGKAAPKASKAGGKAPKAAKPRKKGRR